MMDGESGGNEDELARVKCDESDEMKIVLADRPD